MPPASDPDHLMDDGPVFATTEIYTTHGGTVDPSVLLTNVHNDPMSLSPEVKRSELVANGVGSYDPHAAVRRNGDSNGTKSGGALTLVPKGSQYPPLPYATSRTGLVYDVRMRFHVEPKPTEEDMHPEDPRRIWSVYNALVQAGLVDDPKADQEPSEYVVGRIEARYAEKAEVCLVHTPEHYEFVMSLAGRPAR